MTGGCFPHITCHKADRILINTNLPHVMRVTNEVSSRFWRETGLADSWTTTSEGDKWQRDRWAPVNWAVYPVLPVGPSHGLGNIHNL